MAKECAEPLCRFDAGYNYRNIQVDITTHVSFLMNRINEAAARAMWVFVNWKDVAESERQLAHWLTLYNHYLDVMGAAPLPAGYSVRLLAEGDETP